MDCLAKTDKLSAEDIAAKSRVSQTFALKILRKLRNGGLVDSIKGAQGGYRLAREPKDISLKDVIEAVEGPYNLSRCLSDGYTCAHAEECGGCTCRFQPIFDEISELVRTKLGETTFEPKN